MKKTPTRDQLVIAELRRALRVTQEIIRHSDAKNVLVDLGRPNQGLGKYISRVLADTREHKPL